MSEGATGAPAAAAVGVVRRASVAAVDEMALVPRARASAAMRVDAVTRPAVKGNVSVDVPADVVIARVGKAVPRLNQRRP